WRRPVKRDGVGTTGRDLLGCAAPAEHSRMAYVLGSESWRRRGAHADRVGIAGRIHRRGDLVALSVADSRRDRDELRVRGRGRVADPGDGVARGDARADGHAERTGVLA